MAKILVVEDESDLRSAIVDELNDEGHVTIEAGNGLEGLEKLTADIPDIIISDITMPEMNGYQFLRSVKEKHPEFAEIPFVFLTALANRDDELKGLRLGVDEYITKPIDFGLLIARVELALRRRPAQSVSKQMPESPTGSEAASGSDQGDETPAAKLDNIIQDNDGRVLTGKFETVSLEAIREKIGDRWSEASDSILTNAEAVIREHLGAKDTFHITPSKDFLVCFADRSEEQVDTKVSLIRDAIWDRLISQTGDEDLSRVDGQAFELSLNQDKTKDVDTFFSEIDDAVDKQKALASEGSQRTLSQIFRIEDLYALALITSKGLPSKIKMLSFEKKYNNRIRKLFGSGRFEGAFLLELQQALIERLKEKRTFREAFKGVAMLLPIRFDLMSDEKVRDGLIDLCKDLERSLGVTLIIEVTDTPDRINSHIRALTPLPVGRQLQFLELRRTVQLTNLDISELNGQGVAFVSMPFDHAKQHEENNLCQFVQELERKGIKFFVKDVPEGRLAEAQFSNAHLYSIRR